MKYLKENQKYIQKPTPLKIFKIILGIVVIFIGVLLLVSNIISSDKHTTQSKNSTLAQYITTLDNQTAQQLQPIDPPTPVSTPYSETITPEQLKLHYQPNNVMVNVTNHPNNTSILTSQTTTQPILDKKLLTQIQTKVYIPEYLVHETIICQNLEIANRKSTLNIGSYCLPINTILQQACSNAQFEPVTPILATNCANYNKSQSFSNFIKTPYGQNTLKTCGYLILILIGLYLAVRLLAWLVNQIEAFIAKIKAQKKASSDEFVKYCKENENVYHSNGTVKCINCKYEIKQANTKHQECPNCKTNLY